MKITTGFIPFGKFKTFYRVVGDMNSPQKPLILLHGGPGSTHNYFESFDELAKNDRPVIMYDQLGCGESSIPDTQEFYTLETWIAELENLINYLKLTEYHLLGQSFGGMLAIMFTIDKKPKGLKTLILSSTLSSAKLWAKEQHRLIKFMSVEEQKAIQKAEEKNNFSGKGYLKANKHFMELYATGPFAKEDPEYLTRKKNTGKMSYLIAWGPNEYTPNGNLKNFDYTNKLKQIKIPTLITSGIDDLSTPLIAKTMYDAIPNARWELFAHSRHMPFIDEHDLYLKKLSNWLKQKESN